MARAESPPAMDFSDGGAAGKIGPRLETHLMAKGDDSPGIDLHATKFDALLLDLHTHATTEQMLRDLPWSQAELAGRLQFLVDQGLAKQLPDGTTLPTVMVVTETEGKDLAQLVEPTAQKVTKMVASHLADIIKRYAGLSFASKVSLREMSLFVLSDVLLDRQQLPTIEKKFIKAERSERHGRHYYLSVMSRSQASDAEAFGIYDETYRTIGSYGVAIYGTATYAVNFHTLTRRQLTEWFTIDAKSDLSLAKSELIRQYVETPLASLPFAMLHGFEKIGMIRNGRAKAPIVHPADEAILTDMANSVSDDLLALLEKDRPRFQKAYDSSPYKNEVSFAEYFIWVYHFVYSRATDLLIEQQLIQSPPMKVLHFIHSGS